MRSSPRFLLVLLAVLAAAGGTLRAQDTLSHGKPADVDMSAVRLRAAVRLFDEAVEKGELRGVVVLVARRRQIVLHEAFGWRDLGKKMPMRKDSLFRMASNTKAVVAAGVLTLVDDHKLGLDDPIHEYLPSFDNKRGEKITVRQLLTHTSGLRIQPIFLRPLIRRSKAHPDAPSLQVEVARFGKIGAEKEPGTAWSYSNPGYNTLAALIEVVSKQPLKVYLRKRIYEPLGMKDSCNHEPDADHSRMSAIFRGSAGRTASRLNSRSNSRPSSQPSSRPVSASGSRGVWRTGWKPGDKPDYPFPRGSGGMISTAWDYAVFCQMYLNGGAYGGKRVLSGQLAAAATKPQSEHIKAAQRYGFGWSASSQDGVFSHGGSDGTWAWVDPRREIIGLVFTQCQRVRNPRNEFRRRVTAACTNVPPESGPAASRPSGRR